MKPLRAEQIELIDDMLVQCLRNQTPAERLAAAFACNRTMRQRLAGHFQSRHPDWTSQQIDAAVATRILNGTD